MISHAVNITIWEKPHDEWGLFSSEFKYASYYSCMVSILDGSVIVVSLISFRYFAGPGGILLYSFIPIQWRVTAKGAGGGLNFFQGCAARISEVWGLRTDTCLWKGMLVNWKFPDFGPCERKIFKFWCLWAENSSNLGACELNFGWKLRL